MVYFSLLVLLLLFAGIDYHFRSNTSLENGNKTVLALSNYSGSHRYVSLSSLLALFWFLYAILVMGLRGDFSADYNSYGGWFYTINNMTRESFWTLFGFKNIFSEYLETGYALLNRCIGVFTSNSIWLFVVCAFITCLPVYNLFKRSENIWLAILLWISIGPYLESFNIMRGAMAASILTCSLKYIQERKPIKYLLVVLLATTFHSIAILMVFVYFLPSIRPSKKSIFVLFAVSFFISISGEVLAVEFNKMFHVGYNDAAVRDMFYSSKSSGLSLIAPLTIEALSLIVFFQLVKRDEIDLNDQYVRIVFNGNLIWTFFQIMCLVTAFSTRFAMLFFYYPCMFISFISEKTNNRISTKLILLLAIAWYLVKTLVIYPSYYFTV